MFSNIDCPLFALEYQRFAKLWKFVERFGVGVKRDEVQFLASFTVSSSRPSSRLPFHCALSIGQQQWVSNLHCLLSTPPLTFSSSSFVAGDVHLVNNFPSSSHAFFSVFVKCNGNHPFWSPMSMYSMQILLSNWNSTIRTLSTPYLSHATLAGVKRRQVCMLPVKPVVL